MASLYKRTRSDGGSASPFWWVCYRDPQTDQVRRESTGYRFGFKDETKKARELEALKTLNERRGRPGTLGEGWNAWVDDFLAARCSQSPKTLLRYRNAWRNLAMFLDEREVRIPRQLTRAHCFAYTEWRKEADCENQKYRAGHNTAVLELKLLGMVMKEAVIRGYAPANPARELGIKRAARKKFPEYSDAELKIISEAIDREPKKKQGFFRNSFLVARYHGVRLLETHVNPMADVALWSEGEVRCGSIVFRQKGDKVRTKPLHPKLVPLFEDLRSRGALENFKMPKSFAKEWHNLLIRSGIKAASPNACFHSLRVTVKSRLRRAGIGKELAMEYLSHEAGDVDESYNRFTLQDLRECHRAL